MQVVPNSSASKLAYEDNKSRLKIGTDQYLQLEEEIKKIKYPTYAISNAQNLQSKIQSFKNETVRKQLREYLANLNSYRKIRGDGNCFFRALAFSFLITMQNPSVQQCFPHLDQFSLASCYPESIPSDFRKFYDHQFLLKMLKHYWQPLYSKLLKQSDKNPRKALIKVFDQFPFLDFIVILYFRAWCLKTLKMHQQKLKDFLLGNDQQCIRKYSSETEGVTIQLCGLMTNIIIHVYQVRKDVVKFYHYDNIETKKSEIHLLFYENHYDIIQKNQQIQAEKQTIRVTEDFYGDVNKKMKRSRCFECQRFCQVYQQSQICPNCFQKIANAEKKFQQKPQVEKLIRARCNDCKFTRQDVSEVFGLCKRCIRHQNQIGERRAKQMEQKRKKQLQSPPPKMIRGKCIQCEYSENINSETGICNFCANNQKKVLNKIEKDQQRQQMSASNKLKPQNYQSSANQGKQEYKMATSQFWAKKSQSDKKDERMLNSDMDRFKLSETVRDEKNMRIGVQIKDKDKIPENKQRQSIKKSEQRYSWQKPVLEIKIKQPQKQQKVCSSCEMSGEIQPSTPICKRCFKKQFKGYGLCVKCHYKQVLNQQSRRCKECHNFGTAEKKKSVNQQPSPTKAKLICTRCREKTQYKQFYCEKCYKQCYCAGCKRMNVVTSLTRGYCNRCRATMRV